MTREMQVPVSLLEELVSTCLSKLGIEQDDAQVVRDVLFYAQARGNSQGLIKILEGTVTPDPDAGEITILSERGAVLRIDGQQNLGMVVCHRAVREAQRMASAFGIAFVGTCNTSTSTGAIGFYARELACAGLIGIVLSGSSKVTAMEGGIDPVFGTNPIAIAVPTNGEPLILDMATSTTALFALIAAQDRGEAIDEGIALDAEGEPTTDPSAALAGVMRTFGGHKGAGLALMIEILTGPLLGAGMAGDDDAATNRGCSFIAINPSFLVDEDQFQNRVEALGNIIRNSRRRTGVEEITLPGERSHRRAEQVRESGLIALDRDLYERLCSLASGT